MRRKALTPKTTWRRSPSGPHRVKATVSVLAEFHVGGRPDALMNVCNYNSQTRSNFSEY